MSRSEFSRYSKRNPSFQLCLAGLTVCLFFLCLVTPSIARVVTVEEGSGVGLLVNQGGNCYVILPSHVHGRRRDGIRLGSERAGGPIGSATIVHVVPGDADISLGLVRGGVSRDCGFRWADLPRRLNDTQLLPGTPVILRRPRQSMVEGRRLIIESSGFREIRLVPQVGETADLFGGTSGAVVFADDKPLGMVRQSKDPTAAVAIRIDEIVAQLSRFLGGHKVTKGSADTTLSQGDALGDPVEAISWSAHPIDESVDPVAMLAGKGPWVFELGSEPVRLELLLTETDRLSRVRMEAKESSETSIPRRITIESQASSDPARPRSTDLTAPEMTPDGQFDLRIGEIFSKRVIITIHSSWGDDPVRLDSILID